MELFTDKAKYKLIEYLQDKTDNGKYLGIYLMVSKYPIEDRIAIMWGIYEDFAESLGYIIEISCSVDSELNPDGTWEWFITDLSYLIGDYFNKNIINTRHEARLEAIKELNNLINKDEEV